MADSSLDGTITFGLKDSLYGHAAAANNGNLGIAPKHLIFDRGHGPHKVSFYTDLDLDKVSDDTSSELKVAWLIESPEVHKDAYHKIQDPALYTLFDLVLTCDKTLLELDSRFTFTPVGGCWIPEPNRQLFTKTKDLSIIASNKTDLEGQRLRQEIIEKFSTQINGVFGRGYNEIDDKTDGLRNFRYSLVVENCRTDYYFTEKIIDCFATGTVPIYWGCPSISNFFDPGGIISFNNIEELNKILNEIGPEDYSKRLTSVHNNFSSYHTFAVTEDYIYNEIVLKNPAFANYL